VTRGPDGSFDAGPPSGLVIDRRGVLFGASFYGGKYSNFPPYGGGLGTLFSLAPPASPGGPWTEGVFSIGSQGVLDGPSTGVVLSRGGELYAATLYGGGYCCGALFALVPPAFPGTPWTLRIIQSFGNPNIKNDGQYPDTNVVIDASGVLYGTTGSGGAEGGGEVYSLAPPASPGGAWTYTVLYAPPSSAEQLALGKDGVLYSTTSRGGTSNIGTLFSLAPPTTPGGSWTETTLGSFTGYNGTFPNGGLVIGSGGRIYGTAAGGYSTPPDVGSVFVWKP
jgi:hypothetical protein